MVILVTPDIQFYLLLVITIQTLVQSVLTCIEDSITDTTVIASSRVTVSRNIRRA